MWLAESRLAASDPQLGSCASSDSGKPQCLRAQNPCLTSPYAVEFPIRGPFFDPLKNLVLAGRGTDCRASYIAGRCVMEDFAVVGVDLLALQDQADRQFQKLMASHQARAFGNPPSERLFHPVFPWAD